MYQDYDGKDNSYHDDDDDVHHGKCDYGKEEDKEEHKHTIKTRMT